jgi:hypothetical protein
MGQTHRVVSKVKVSLPQRAQYLSRQSGRFRKGRNIPLRTLPDFAIWTDKTVS